VASGVDKAWPTGGSMAATLEARGLEIEAAVQVQRFETVVFIRVMHVPVAVLLKSTCHCTRTIVCFWTRPCVFLAVRCRSRECHKLMCLSRRSALVDSCLSQWCTRHDRVVTAFSVRRRASRAAKRIVAVTAPITQVSVLPTLRSHNLLAQRMNMD
jgi:hypothetical protein